MDANSAAEILVLVGAPYNQHQIDQKRRILFQPRITKIPSTITTAFRATTRQAPFPGSLDFQSAELNV